MTTSLLLVIGVATYWENSKFREVAVSGTARLADADLDHIVQNVYSLCDTARRALERSVVQNLHAASIELQEAGNLNQDAGTTLNWQAQNQFTKVTSTVSLPKVLVGRTWLGQVRDPAIPVPVVDHIRKLTGATSTIFQRMNAPGDMLRVATNVIGDDGQRAIGTYIPAVGADGRANPVIATVLAGQPYVGRAFVVNSWYVTAYQPIRDATQSIIGMLYVGVPERDASESVRRAVMDVRIGRTGHVFVLNATGANRGHYVISEAGKHDGEDIWESRDSRGALFVQEMCHRAVSLKAGEVASLRYSSGSPDQPDPRDRLSRIRYFQPWDWVLAASVPEDEVYDAVHSIDRIVKDGMRILLFFAFAALALTSVISYFLSHRLTRRTDRIARTLVEVSRSISAAAVEMAQTSECLALETEKQAASASEVESSLHEMEQMARRNLENSGVLAQLAGETHETTEVSAQQVQKLSETMREIQSANADVVDINRLINGIALQTNILALNAAVEAARAGEAGLGFAVVADQVRELAHRCAQAAQNTSQKIQSSISASRQGVEATQELAEKVQNIAESTRKLDRLVQSIALGSTEQTQSVARMATATSVMNRGTESNAATAAGGARRASQFEQQSGALANLAAEIDEIFRGSTSSDARRQR